MTPPKIGKQRPLRFGMRVRVLGDPDSFYHGFVGCLVNEDHDEPFYQIMFDVAPDYANWVHKDLIVPLDRNDPDFDAPDREVTFELEDN